MRRKLVLVRPGRRVLGWAPARLGRLVLVCALLLCPALSGAGPARAADPAPQELWEAYPLEAPARGAQEGPAPDPKPAGPGGAAGAPQRGAPADGAGRGSEAGDGDSAPNGSGAGGERTADSGSGPPLLPLALVSVLLAVLALAVRAYLAPAYSGPGLALRLAVLRRLPSARVARPPARPRPARAPVAELAGLGAGAASPHTDRPAGRPVHRPDFARRITPSEFDDLPLAPYGGGRAPGATVAPPRVAQRQTCVIDWQPEGREAHFAALLDAPGGARRAIADSPGFWWPSASPPLSTHASLEAHRRLVERLEDDGWAPAGGGNPWFARRFER